VVNLGRSLQRQDHVIVRVGVVNVVKFYSKLPTDTYIVIGNGLVSSL